MKTRYRTAHIKTGLFTYREVLVLQVLKSIPDGPSDHNGLPAYLAHEKWVDASVTDLTLGEKK